MEEKGEFEPRPEVKPADQVPLPQKKANPTIGILCVIFALVALGLCGYIIYDKFIASEAKTECAVADNKGEGNNADEEAALMGDEDHGFIFSPSAYGSSYGDYYVTNVGDVYLRTYDKYNEYGTSKEWSPTMSKESGEKGVYELKHNDIRGSWPYTDTYDDSTTEESFNIEGFKLNLTNIRYVSEIRHGQRKSGVEAAFIDKDGNLNLLLAKDDGTYPLNTLVLKKNIEKNVTSVLTVYNNYNGYITMVFYRDGSSKMLDSNVFDIL